jgi:hypothetical protein
VTDLSIESAGTKLQEILVACATGGPSDPEEYKKLRLYFLNRSAAKPLLPDFVITCRDLGEFWDFIKPKFPTYQERRVFLRERLRPLLDAIEAGSIGSVADAVVTRALQDFSSEGISTVWRKALERRTSDPEAALTSARSLLETTLKHILDEREIEYRDRDDLPELYRAVSDSLNLSPGQHTEDLFRRILGGCVSIVEGVGAIRNKLGDAHGRGRGAPQPNAHHAALAVNLAGAMATFLIDAHKADAPASDQ